jgi:hypothetical protein
VELAEAIGFDPTAAIRRLTTIQATAASVQAQTYPTLAHVLRDNASNDDTPGVIERARAGRVPIVRMGNARQYCHCGTTGCTDGDSYLSVLQLPPD